MRRRILSILGVLAVAAAFTFTSCGGTVAVDTDTNYYELAGYVKDAEGLPVVGATVTVYVSKDVPTTGIKSSSARELVLTTATTGSKGEYAIGGLTEGTYDVFFTSPISISRTGDNKATHMNFHTTTTLSTTDILSGTNPDYITKNLSVTLPKLGATFGGTLYSDKDLNTPAASTSVSLDLSTFLIGATVTSGYSRPVATLSTDGKSASFVAASEATYATVTTGTDGTFSFTDLPIIALTTAQNKLKAITGYNGAALSTTIVDVTDYAAIDFKTGNTSVTASKLYLPVTYTALALESSNARNYISGATYNTQILDVSSAITLTFNKALSTDLTTSTAYLLLGSTVVPSTFAISGKVVTITPSQNLDYGTTYTIVYKVSDGITAGTTTTLTNFFTTIANPGLPVKVTDLNLDTRYTTKYNEGDSSIKVQFTYNPKYTYTSASRLTTTDDPNTEWTIGSAVTIGSYAGTTAYATISTVTMVSGKTLEIKLIETLTTGGDALYTDSNTLSVTDTTAPTGSLTSTVVNTSRNATRNGVATLTFTLGGETMQLPTSTLSTGATGVVSVTWTLKADGTAAYARVETNDTTTTLAATLQVTLKDGQGNVYDTDLATANNQTLDINLAALGL
jgi:hypothetical protein